MSKIADVIAKIRADLAWRGPGGKCLGHVVLERRAAELMLAALDERQQDKTENRNAE